MQTSARALSDTASTEPVVRWPDDHHPGAALVEFYGEYCPPRFPQAQSRRAKQQIAKKYKLPIIRVGNACLICPADGDDHLRRLALHRERERRGRGRPRTISSP